MEKKEVQSYTEALKLLSPREAEILELVDQGYLNNEISEKLSLSVRTVQTHRNNICRKLCVKGRLGLVKWLWKVRNGKNQD